MNDLLRALAEASEDDLAAIDERLAALKRESESLTVLRRALAARFGAAPAPAPGPGPAPAKGGGEAPPRNGHKDAVAQNAVDRAAVAFILLEEGPQPSRVLTGRMGYPPSGNRIFKILDHEWFEREGNLWRLTDGGREAALRECEKGGEDG